MLIQLSKPKLAHGQLALRQPELPRAPRDLPDLLTDLEPVELVARELQSRLFIWQVLNANAMGISEKRRSHLLMISKTIGLLVAQYMPDGYQQLARNGHNRFLPANVH
mgnify:CR=1 FL=1